MSLKDDLTDIDGIGDSRADEILAVVEEHYRDKIDRENVSEAHESLKRNRKRRARVLLERALQ